MNPMQSTPLTTEFASAERASISTVRHQAAAVAQQPLISELLNSVLDYVLILNRQRQIVFASSNLQKLVPGMELNDLLGQRPGEALGCTHSKDSNNGCGTTAFCKECGAAKSILASLAGRKDCQECRMIRISDSEEEALDLLVTGTPLKIEGQTYSLLALADISHEKRRRALERIFFHDVINSAGGLEGRIRMLDKSAPGELREQVGLLRAGVHQVLEEILAQRDLIAAENNELPVEPQPLESRHMLEKVLQLYLNHPVARDRGLRIDPDSTPEIVETDPRLLGRILGNLIKNALEASQVGQVVTVGCMGKGDDVQFRVHNLTFMPPNVQLQVFNRSYSTKGSGRGLGTYSVKLLTQRYLKGKVGFVTDEKDGTTFFVTLPRQHQLTPTLPQEENPNAGGT